MIEADQTRERIVTAARELISRKGKRGATTRDIADLAGVNEVTLFRHFGNKDALILAVVKASCPDTQLRETVSQLRGPIERDLQTIGVAMVSHLESMIDMIRWSLTETEHESRVFSKEAWRSQTVVRHIVTDYFYAQVDAGTISGNPEDLASAFIGMLFSRTIARENFRDSRLFNDSQYAVRFFVNVFLNGVRSN